MIIRNLFETPYTLQAIHKGKGRGKKTGDVILNKPGWQHGLENTSEELLKLLVFEVDQVG